MSGTPNGTPPKANSSPQLPRGILGRSGTPLLPGARLPSLRGPRDLTLSGSSPGGKRTFAPNVAATRRAPKEEDGPEKGRGLDAVRGFHHQGGGRGRQRGRGECKGRYPSGRGRPAGRGHSSERLSDRGSDRFIQTQGATFAQGVEGDAKTTSGFPKWNNRSESVHVEKPKLHNTPSSTSLTSEEKAEDQKKLELLLRGDFIDDGPAETPRLYPTTLPLLEPAKPASEHKPPVKSEVPVIKQEPTEEPVLAKAVPSTALKRMALADLCTDPNLPEIGQLLFFQLPDSLPGLDTPSEQPEKEEVPSLQAPSLVKMEEPETFCGQVKLRHFPEGYVGKLQVLKSGRVRLLLGAVALTVDTGTQTSFRQDLISLRLSESGGADASVLGQVQYKLMCLPDVEQLLAANPGVS